MKKFCPNCGKELKLDDEFCPNCGTKIYRNKNVSNNQKQPVNPNPEPSTLKVHPQQSQPAPQQIPEQNYSANNTRRRSKGPAPKKSNKNKILWGIGIAAVVLAVGGASYYGLNKSQHQEVSEVSSKKHTKAKKSKKSNKSEKTKSKDADSSYNEADENEDSEPSSSRQNSSDKNRLWTSKQEAALADYMDFFGDQMHQSYDEYTGGENLKTLSGEKYPDIFKNTKFRYVTKNMDADEAEDQPAMDIGWDPNATKNGGKYEYNVVSIFNDNVGKPELHITYLFCFKDGEPIVLVDQTTNGDSIAVMKTANKYLPAAFEAIANNEKPSYDDFER